MLTCAEQISAGLFTFQKHIRPRRVLVVDEQKQLVATFPLFVHDGSRRGAPPDAPPAMIQNLVTMETFAIRDGLIRHVEAFPFVTVPYGWGVGWTIGSGRSTPARPRRQACAFDVPRGKGRRSARANR